MTVLLLALGCSTGDLSAHLGRLEKRTWFLRNSATDTDDAPAETGPDTGDEGIGRPDRLTATVSVEEPQDTELHSKRLVFMEGMLPILAIDYGVYDRSGQDVTPMPTLPEPGEVVTFYFDFDRAAAPTLYIADDAGPLLVASDFDGSDRIDGLDVRMEEEREERIAPRGSGCGRYFTHSLRVETSAGVTVLRDGEVAPITVEGTEMQMRVVAAWAATRPEFPCGFTSEGQIWVLWR